MIGEKLVKIKYIEKVKFDSTDSHKKKDRKERVSSDSAFHKPPAVVDPVDLKVTPSEKKEQPPLNNSYYDRAAAAAPPPPPPTGYSALPPSPYSPYNYHPSPYFYPGSYCPPPPPPATATASSSSLAKGEKTSGVEAKYQDTRRPPGALTVPHYQPPPKW